MNRRGFLGSLATLVGAKAFSGALPGEAPPAALPVHTAGYLQTINDDGVTSTITSYTENTNVHWITAQLDPDSEGIRWNYTTGTVR
jgi:hypothetical protein